MRKITMNGMLRSTLLVGLASFPLMAADVSADSGAGNFYALVFGLMATLFGGMAFCYGLVKLTEKVVHALQARHAMAIAVPRIRHAA
jgi:hypothetical protein